MKTPRFRRPLGTGPKTLVPGLGHVAAPPEPCPLFESDNCRCHLRANDDAPPRKPRAILLPAEGPEPTFWLTIGTSPQLPVLHLPLEIAATQAAVNGGELLKFHYLPTPDYDDPHAKPEPRVYGRIRIETRGTPYPD